MGQNRVTNNNHLHNLRQNEHKHNQHNQHNNHSNISLRQRRNQASYKHESTTSFLGASCCLRDFHLRNEQNQKNFRRTCSFEDQEDLASCIENGLASAPCLATTFQSESSMQPNPQQQIYHCGLAHPDALILIRTVTAQKKEGKRWGKREKCTKCQFKGCLQSSI